VFGIFLIGYAVARTAVEGFRQADAQFVTPDNPHGQVIRFGAEWGLTMGQVLSLPMLAVGVLLVVLSARRT
jgi:phosphatidylglycerol:prolipoprotein diacylglycerol transferase